MSEADAPRSSGIEVDIVRIMQMIPHRLPFLMIDRVVDMHADKGAIGITMAQTAAVLVVHTLGPKAEGKLVYFMSVDNCRFRRPVYPGDQLIIEVKKDRNRGPVWKFEGVAKVAGKVVAEADFAAMVREDT